MTTARSRKRRISTLLRWQWVVGAALLVALGAMATVSFMPTARADCEGPNAQVVTDQEDYPPGDTVRMDGC